MQNPSKAKLPLTLCFLLFMSTSLAAGSASSASAAASTFGFGNQQIGAASNSTFGGLFLSNFTAPGNVGNITQIQVYLATGGTTARGVIYSDVNGVPVSLLAESDPVEVAGTDGAWVSFSVNYTGLPFFTYWIGVLAQGAATIYYAQGANGTALYTAQGAMNATLCPAGTTAAGDALSAYAVYTPTLTGEQGTDWIPTVLMAIAVVGVVLAAVVLALYIRGERQKEPAQAST